MEAQAITCQSTWRTRTRPQFSWTGSGILSQKGKTFFTALNQCCLTSPQKEKWATVCHWECMWQRWVFRRLAQWNHLVVQSWPWSLWSSTWKAVSSPQMPRFWWLSPMDFIALSTAWMLPGKKVVWTQASMLSVLVTPRDLLVQAPFWCCVTVSCLRIWMWQKICLNFTILFVKFMCTTSRTRPESKRLYWTWSCPAGVVCGKATIWFNAFSCWRLSWLLVACKIVAFLWEGGTQWQPNSLPSQVERPCLWSNSSTSPPRTLQPCANIKLTSWQ